MGNSWKKMVKCGKSEVIWLLIQYRKYLAVNKWLHKSIQLRFTVSHYRKDL